MPERRMGCWWALLLLGGSWALFLSFAAWVGSWSN
jgi:hypothetical protein